MNKNKSKFISVVLYVISGLCVIQAIFAFIAINNELQSYYSQGMSFFETPFEILNYYIGGIYQPLFYAGILLAVGWVLMPKGKADENSYDANSNIAKNILQVTQTEEIESNSDSDENKENDEIDKFTE